MSYKRKFEVSLPLEEIDREKYIRHGQCSAPQLWGARCPLAACRAANFAQFGDDPSSRPKKVRDNDDQTTERTRREMIRAENQRKHKYTNSSAIKLQSIKIDQHRARLEAHTSNPARMGANVKHAMEELPRHTAAAEGGKNVAILPDVRTDGSGGFSEGVVRTVRENSHVLGFGVSEFEDAEW